MSKSRVAGRQSSLAPGAKCVRGGGSRDTRVSSIGVHAEIFADGDAVQALCKGQCKRLAQAALPVPLATN